jgi:predicted DNA-binding protein with PD1-like motif
VWSSRVTHARGQHRFPGGRLGGDLKEGDPVVHLHCTLGTVYGNLSGGHLFKATVLTTTEILIASIKGSQVKKKQGAVTGLTELRTDV